MGSRGSKGNTETKKTEKELKPGELGKKIGEEKASIQWLVEKNLSQNQQLAIGTSDGYRVERETEKAYLLAWSTDYGKVTMWAPKGAVDKKVPLYDANGSFKLGDTVVHENGVSGGKISKITDTHTHIGSGINTIKVRNENLHTKYTKSTSEKISEARKAVKQKNKAKIDNYFAEKGYHREKGPDGKMHWYDKNNNKVSDNHIKQTKKYLKQNK